MSPQLRVSTAWGMRERSFSVILSALPSCSGAGRCGFIHHICWKKGTCPFLSL